MLYLLFRSMTRMAVALIGLVAFAGAAYLLVHVQPSTGDEIATWIVCALAVAAVVYFGWMIFGITQPSSAPEAKGRSATRDR